MPAKSTRRATDVAAADDQQRLRGIKTQLRTAKDRLQQRVCTPANGYAGKPSDYYYVPGYCVNRDAKAAVKRPTATMGVAAAQTKREIQLLDKALKEYPKDYNDGNIIGSNLYLTIGVFSGMLDTKARLQHPDPVQRYKYLIGMLQSNSKGRAVEFTVPRFTVLSLVAEALKRLH